jgi:hypothetical protein
MAAGDIIITNNSTCNYYGARLWQEGTIAATTDDSLKSGNVPGVYEFTVVNSDKWDISKDSYIINGKVITFESLEDIFSGPQPDSNEVASVLADQIEAYFPGLYTVSVDDTVVTVTEKDAYVNYGIEVDVISGTGGSVNKVTTVKPELNEYATVSPNSGEVSFKKYLTEEYYVLSAKLDPNTDVEGTGNNDGNQLKISAPNTTEESDYYKSLGKLPNLTVTVATS